MEQTEFDSVLLENKGNLKKLDLTTGEITDVYDEEIGGVRIYKDYVYFHYAKEKIDEYAYYRMDTNGENIIKVTGDIPAQYLSFDRENDRIRFSNALIHTSYTAALDGSDLQEESNDNSYDAIKEKYNLDAFAFIRNDDSDEEKTELNVIGTKYDGYTYFIKENGDEVFELKLPEGVRPYDVTVADDRLFYDVRNGKYESEKWYVNNIDEIMGMNDISVGKEKVDGKYEITGGEYKYIPSEEDGIHCIKFDDGISRKIIDGYYIFSGRIEDNKLLIKKDDDYIIYSADLDGSNIQEHGSRRINSGRTEDTELNLNENAMYGIIVKNDGTVESYYNRIRPY